MSDDIVQKAETLYAKLDFDAIQTRQYWTYERYFQAAKMLPGLVAEIKRLQADNKFLHKFVDDPGSTLEAALNAVREQSDVIQKQQVAFADAITTAAATLAKWQQIAIDERANQIAGIPVSHLKDKDKRDAYREQAAKELDEDLTIAYMLGSQKANERLKVLQGYVTRLEAAYIDMVFSATGSDKEAQDALTKIREEPTC